jgi:hypothetical protein
MCPNGDFDGGGTVTVDEIVTALNFALDGCPAGYKFASSDDIAPDDQPHRQVQNRPRSFVIVSIHSAV